MAVSPLGPGDYAVIALYFLAVIATGIYSLCRPNRGTVSGYFLAGRYIYWLPVGASIFASNIGSDHFIGLAGSGAASGIAVGAFELNALLIVQLLGFVFLPVFIASGVSTLPEYMTKRFGGSRIRTYLAVLSLLLYVFTKISVDLYSGAIFIKVALDWDLYWSVLLLLLVTVICTVTGGLAAVIYTDTLQFFIMIIGSVILTAMSFTKIGGFQNLYYDYLRAMPSTTYLPNNQSENETKTGCGIPFDNSWVMLRSADDETLPWLGFILGQLPASVWYWCADQMIVQRALAAKSLSHAQGGVIMTGYMKVLPVFLFVLPGMISRVLYTDEVACADPQTCLDVCGSRISCSNLAYPLLVMRTLPDGLRGLMTSVMLAALMSDLTSIFNSASTLFTMDIYHRIRTTASVKQLMIVGRLFVVVMVAVSIAWIPVIEQMQGGQLFFYIQAISAFLAPPIAAVYLIAVLWIRGTEKGAFWGLLFGLIIGALRMVLEFASPEPACGDEDKRFIVVKNFHYMYFALVSFWLTGIIMVVVSIFTKESPEELLIRTTFWTRFDQTSRSDGVLHESLDTSEGDRRPEQYIDFNSGATPCENTPTETQPISAAAASVESPKSLAMRMYNWFCGFDDTEKGHQAAEEQRKHLIQLTTLEQDSRAKLFLHINMVIIISVDIFLYAFFSYH